MNRKIIKESIRSYKKMIAELENQLDEPEFKEGDLVEVRDLNDDEWLLGYYRGKTEHGLHLSNCYLGYNQCRHLEHDHILRPIEWHGGECPVDGETWVVYKMNFKASQGKTDQAGNLTWDHKNISGDIIQYAVLSKAWQ